MTRSGDSKPKVVDVDPGFVGEVLREEVELENKKYNNIMKSIPSK